MLLKMRCLEIVDVFELGATADIPLEDTFLLATDFAERKEVKRELAKLSAEYFITKDRKGCLKKFTNNVNLPEVNVLSMSFYKEKERVKQLKFYPRCQSHCIIQLLRRLLGKIK